MNRHLLILAGLLALTGAALADPTAEVTVVPNSGVTASAAVIITNKSAPSTPATTETLHITVQDDAGKVLTTQTVLVSHPAVDTRWTGAVTMDVPPGETATGLDPSYTVTSDAAGQHIKIPVTALDGGASVTAMFTLTKTTAVNFDPVTVLIKPPPAAPPSPISAVMTPAK